MSKIEFAPDWSKAPAWANYWAVDIDGSAFWYAKEPEPDLDDEGKEYGVWIGDKFPDKDYEWVHNWKETLCKRPEPEQKPIRSVSIVYFVHELESRIEALERKLKE